MTKFISCLLLYLQSTHGFATLNQHSRILYKKEKEGVAMTPRFPSDCPTGFISHYFVISGDTMAKIAKIFAITTEKLISVNPHIPDPNVLIPGDVLCVPGFRVPVECPPNYQIRYEVDYGETMFSIARRFNISVEELIAANPHIPEPNYIYPFDVLCVP